MIPEKHDYGLRPLWNALLSIYNEYRTICERHGLRYWAAFGTALGAVRHKGFIPWDDDFDVMMPRSDYERFMEVASKELPAYLKVINWRNTDGYKWLFGKIQDVRKDQLHRLEVQLGRILPQGVYIDILPCDGYPETHCCRLRHKLRGLLLCARREYCTCPKNKRRNVRRRVMIILGSLLGWKWPKEKLLRDFVELNERRVRECNYESAQYVITDGVRYSLGLTGTVYPAAIFQSGTVEMPFENVSVPMLADWVRYLEIEFGDWRKLPPIQKRAPTHENEEIAPWR